MRRFPALQHLDISACRRVSDEELASLPAMRSLRSVVLSGCEDVSDAGVQHLARITQLSSLNMSNCCRVRDPVLFRQHQLLDLYAGEAVNKSSGACPSLVRLQCASLIATMTGRHVFRGWRHFDAGVR